MHFMLYAYTCIMHRPITRVYEYSCYKPTVTPYNEVPKAHSYTLLQSTPNPKNGDFRAV